MTARVSMLMYGVYRNFETRWDHWKTTVKHNFRRVSNGRGPE